MGIISDLINMGLLPSPKDPISIASLKINRDSRIDIIEGKSVKLEDQDGRSYLVKLKQEKVGKIYNFRQEDLIITPI